MVFYHIYVKIFHIIWATNKTKTKRIINVHKNVVYYTCVDPLPTDSFILFQTINLYALRVSNSHQTNHNKTEKRTELK